MDNIRVRTHKELGGISEKFYGMSIRQWIFVLLGLGICVPLYLYGKPYLGEELVSWLILLIGVPIMLCGFLTIQGLPVNRLVPFWMRHYLDFAKPLQYKTKEQLAEEAFAKTKAGKKAAKQAAKEEERRMQELLRLKQQGLLDTTGPGENHTAPVQSVPLSKKERKKQEKIRKQQEKERIRQQKILREQQKQLAQAKEMYASESYRDLPRSEFEITE